MRESGGVKPLIAIDLVVANDVANPVGKYLGATAGERIHARSLELFEGLANRELGALRKVRDLNHGERFEVNLRKALLQPRAEVEEIVKRQIGMQSANDMKLSDRLGVARGSRFESLLKRHGVGARRILFAAEGAKAAGRDAYVRRIDVAIYVEVSLIAMHALADVIGHPAHRENIAGAVQREQVRGGEALAGHYFGMNRRETRIVRLKWIVPARSEHPLDDIAGTRRKSPVSGLVAGVDTVVNPVVLRFGNDTAGYHFLSVVERTFGDDAVGVVFAEAGQRKQILPGSLIHVENFIAAHAFLDAIRHSFGIAPHGLRGFRRALADLFWVIFRGAGDGYANHDRGNQRADHPEGNRADRSSRHIHLMPCLYTRLANNTRFSAPGRYKCAAVDLILKCIQYV